MSFTYGFYESKNGDRTYKARQFARLFDGLITDGVFATVGSAFAVKPSSGMSVSVGTGKAWFNHTWSENDTEMIVTTAESDMLLPRIDALVLEVDETESVRANSIKFITGTAATEPVNPTLTNTEFIHQYVLKYIDIPANSTEIKAENIKNMVGTSECPFVTGLLEGINIDILVAQWEAQFDAWFENLKTQLDGDVAGNLQNQINNITPETIGAMPKSGGAFTGYVDILPGLPFDIKTKNGNRLRLLGDTETDRAFIHILKADGTFVTDIIEVDTETGNIISTPLMPRSGGYMEGTMYARTDGRNIPFNTGEVMNIGIRTSDGSQAVKSAFILMQRK